MPHLATYVALADRSEQTLSDSLREVAAGHSRIPDVFHTCQILAGWSDQHRELLRPIVERYGESPKVDEPDRLHAAGVGEAREGDVGLLRDLQDLHVLATLVQTTWTALAQGAQGLRDTELLDVARSCSAETARQVSWFTTKMKTAAPQALIVG